MEKYLKILDRLEKSGITVSRGLTEEEIGKIEEVYGFTFPRELVEFYSCGLPIGEQFPIWNDFSDENVRMIREKIELPIKALRSDVEDWFWIDSWGDQPESREEELAVFDSIAERAPKMIPIYGHRYMPALDGAPIISTVGADSIYYGYSLVKYLNYEFFGIKDGFVSGKVKKVPFWSNLIERR
ncbi:MAG: SMI1/KNR4 family protein [Clostridia bacterium]|nr:SMI1/KNR4 family protein [Clostridia bacterium]